MALFSLAMQNVRRRLGRGVLSLLAMTFAAAVLTSGLSLSHGKAAQAQWHFRDYFGGDIMVFTPGFTSPNSSTEDISRRTLFDSGFNPLVRFYPEFEHNGYYAEDAWKYRSFNDEDLSMVLSHPEVAEVTQYVTMPAILPYEDRNVNLRIYPEGQAWEWEDWSGTRTVPTDFDVYINSYGGSNAGLGDILVMEVPFFRVDKAGIPYVDWGAGFLTYHVRVVGKGQMRSRLVNYQHENGHNEIEQGYLHAPEIYLPEDQWHELWGIHAGGADYRALALALRVKDMGLVNATAKSLQEENPQWTVFTVPALVEHGYKYSQLDFFYRAPRCRWEHDPSGQKRISQDGAGTLTALLLFLIAGMLLASQMLTAVTGRRGEIGILKAIGAKTSDITVMVLLESLFTALVGGVAGFLVVKIGGIHQALTNSWPLSSVLRIAGSELLLVLGATVIASLAFGVLPAWKVSQLTVMEVFRNE